MKTHTYIAFKSKGRQKQLSEEKLTEEKPLQMFRGLCSIRSITNKESSHSKVTSCVHVDASCTYCDRFYSKKFYCLPLNISVKERGISERWIKRDKDTLSSFQLMTFSVLGFL